MRSIVRRDTGETYQAFLTRARQGLGHRDADAGRPGAAGPETQEEDVEQRLDESARSGREGHEDERWPHAFGAQGRARGRRGDRRDCRRHAAGRRRGDTTTIVETAIAADELEDAQADGEEPQPLEEIIADKGYHSNQTMSRPRAVGHPLLYRGAGPRAARLVEGRPRGAGAGVSQSSPDSRDARTAADAATRRDDRTLLRAPL